jgi:hypothetical protein
VVQQIGDVELGAWWITSRKRVLKPLHNCFDTLIVLVWWLIWKERNARGFSPFGYEPGAVVQLH